MKPIGLCLAIFLMSSLAGTAAAPEKTPAVQPAPVWTSSKFNYRPPDGCVPDTKTAFKIANAILLPIYGEREVEFNKPFTAVLKKGIWTVGGMGQHPNIEGGGMEIDISKSDGRILRIYAGM